LAARIHLGARATTGGVAAFLCGRGGKPACPPTGGTVTATITPANVIGPAGQGSLLASSTSSSLPGAPA